LGAAIKDICQSCRGVPLSALLLLTDGVDTSKADLQAVADYAHSRGVAIHAVGFGSPPSVPDLEVAAVHCPQTAQLGALVPLAIVVNRQAVRVPFKVQLFRGSVFIKDIPVPASDDDTPLALTMSFVAEHKGPNDYRVVIPPVRGEQIVDNNSRDFHLQVDETREQVLFVEGSPRHEFAFIRRVMSDSRFFKIVALVRLGHDRTYSAAEDQSSMLTAFPTTAEDLGRFKAIILSDVEATEFTPTQQALIADFVTVRGGGLLMLGGVNSFNLGGWSGTPIAGLLPVSLAPANVAPSFDDREFAFKLTPEGAEHEILHLAADPKENLSQWDLMPPLRGSNPLYTAKPGAQVLAYAKVTGDQPGRPVIALAVQNVGSGRVAAFASANSWRWRMLRPLSDNTFQQFWSQMIRWLAAGSKGLISIATDDPVASIRQPLTIDVNVLDGTHRPCNTATVSATIQDPLGNSETLAVPWSLQEDGVYRLSYIPTARGQYTITATAQTSSAKMEAPPATFVAVERSVEFAHPAMDGSALKLIAQHAEGTADLNGKLDTAVNSILERLSRQRTEAPLIEERELRDAPILLLLLALLWLAEWTLRRRSGLA
jgi:uncharacterized membrane protein